MATNQLTASRIAAFLQATLTGADVEIARPAPVARAAAGDITFIGDLANFGRTASQQPGQGTLVLMDRAPEGTPEYSFIVVDRPRVAFARVVAEFFASRPVPGIAETARISPEASIGADVHIADYAVVEAGAVIGDRCVLKPHAVVGGGVEIGADCWIGEHAVIGCEGFGNEIDGDAIIDFPHLGAVRLAENVRVGAGSTIARGTLDDTEIGAGTRISQGVNVAHNVRIGRLCTIAGQAQISGSAVIGDRCWLGPNCTITQKVSIGAGSTVGIGSIVHRSMQENGVAIGLEGLDRRQYRKISSLLAVQTGDA